MNYYFNDQILFWKSKSQIKKKMNQVNYADNSFFKLNFWSSDIFLKIKAKN